MQRADGVPIPHRAPEKPLPAVFSRRLSGVSIKSGRDNPMQYEMRKVTISKGRFAAARMLCLLCVMAGVAQAGTWSGVLVDARCYQSEINNRNGYDSTAVRDVGRDVRACAPRATAKSFAIVQPNGEEIAFDAAGNSEAAQLVREGAGKEALRVTVNGAMGKRTIEVSSIAREK
jgi:hypothetical protein